MARRYVKPAVGKLTVPCAICAKPLRRWPTQIRGYAASVCSYRCRGILRTRNASGPDHPKWKGGRKLTRWGYMYVHVGLQHPRATRQGYMLEHRLVMEKHLGRALKSTEVVHHLNGVKTDNRIVNLELCDSLSDHMKRCHSNPPSFCWCGKPHCARGLCRPHYKAAWKRGQLTARQPGRRPSRCTCRPA
jgi:hypothetical protein